MEVTSWLAMLVLTVRSKEFIVMGWACLRVGPNSYVRYVASIAFNCIPKLSAINPAAGHPTVLR